MAIQIAEAPTEGLQIVRDNLMFAVDEITALNVVDGVPAVEIMKPYPIYTARLADLLNGRFLQSARPTSWQYVVVSDEALSLAEVSDLPMSYASLQSGTMAEALVDVMNAAERLEAVAAKDYDLRILRAPELYLLAVWLHASDEDLLLPVRPAPAGIQPGALLRESQLVDVLKPLAEVRRIPSDR